VKKMELQIAGTNVELTPQIQSYVERKLGKLDRHSPGIIEAKVEISEEKTKSPGERYLIRVTLTGGVGGNVFHGEDRGEDLFKAVDKVNAVMKRQLERHKGKLYEKGRGNSLARGKFTDTTAGDDSLRKVVRTKRFVLEPMSLDEAIEGMEELGHNFFLFLDADTEEIKLLYRRNNGDYGLIEPSV
jgi:putative sigma-54 modulation protein